MPKLDWPQREALLVLIDDLKKRHGIAFDSDLAERAGISHSAISNWRHGKVKPSVPALTRIGVSLGEPVRHLLAVAGLVIDGDTTDPLAGLPAELQRLIALYTHASPQQRRVLLQQVAFLNDWAVLSANGPVEAPLHRQLDIGHT